MSRTYEREILHSEVSKKTGNSPTVAERVWVIPDGRELTIIRFSGGHEYSMQEVRMELVHRVSGSDTTIAVGYGESFQFSIDMNFTGNGTDSIVIRHINGDPHALNFASWWEGFTNG